MKLSSCIFSCPASVVLPGKETNAYLRMIAVTMLTNSWNPLGYRQLICSYEESGKLRRLAMTDHTPTGNSRHHAGRSAPHLLAPSGDYTYELESAQRAQTSAKASSLNWKWSGIRIQISGLIQIRFQMFVRSLPKCCASIIFSASVISPSVVKIGRWVTLINVIKSHRGLFRNDERSGKLIRNPYLGADHDQKLSSSSHWYRSNHNTKFQWNQLIIYAVILLIDRITEWQTGDSSDRITHWRS